MTLDRSTPERSRRVGAADERNNRTQLPRWPPIERRYCPTYFLSLRRGEAHTHALAIVARALSVSLITWTVCEHVDAAPLLFSYQ